MLIPNRESLNPARIAPMDDLERWRDEFPILSRTVYMISNSLGAMPRRTARNLAEYADTWATRGVRGWEERWWEMPLEVGNKIARHHRRAGRLRQHARERHDGAHGGAVVPAAVAARAGGSSAPRWIFRRWSISFARRRPPASSCASSPPKTI